MTTRLDQSLSIGMLLAALAAATVLVHREFFRPAALSGAFARRPVYVERWQTLLRDGHWIGSPTASVVVMEFADFECPYCRKFDRGFRATRDSLGGRVALVYFHYPIEGHRFALPAARAAECAASRGAFSRFHDRLFDKQDSLGLKTWQSYAADANVPDTVAFDHCVASGETAVGITRGIELGDSLSVDETPTIFVNGWRLYRIPYDSLRTVIERYSKVATK